MNRRRRLPRVPIAEQEARLAVLETRRSYSEDELDELYRLRDLKRLRKRVAQPGHKADMAEKRRAKLRERLKAERQQMRAAMMRISKTRAAIAALRPALRRLRRQASKLEASHA